jgi:hypothetical protein
MILTSPLTTITGSGQIDVKKKMTKSNYVETKKVNTSKNKLKFGRIKMLHTFGKEERGNGTYDDMRMFINTKFHTRVG